MQVTGHLELLEQGDGLAFAAGWLSLDLELFAAGPAVLLLEPEGAEASTWPLRRLYDRADMPGRDGRPAAQGFQILFPAAIPWTQVTVSVLIGERRIALRAQPVRPDPFRWRGALEAPDAKGVPGWVLAPPDRPPTLLLDGRIAIPIPLHLARADLPFDFGSEVPCFGFRIPLPALGEALRATDSDFTLLDGEPHSVTLLAGGVELGHLVLRHRRNQGGKLERIDGDEVVGWATEADPLEAEVNVDLLIDGTRWLTLPASAFRADLAANGVGDWLAGGAFRAQLPIRSLTGQAEAHVEVRPAHAAAALDGSTDFRGLAPWRSDRSGLLDTIPSDGFSPVSIVVPIHNAAADLRNCIESVLRHSTGRTTLLLLDDASTDPRIAELLAGWAGRPGIEVHRDDTNRGFTVTANRGFALAGRNDVVLLNSDTIVGPGWLDGLRLAAHARPLIGTVTAISNNAGAFSVPEFDIENRLPDGIAPDDMARLARQASLALWPQVPTGNGFCLYIRRACLDAAEGFDEAAFPRGYGEENDFCMRAAAAGFEHVVDDRTWVWHRRSASFGATRSTHVEAGQAVLAERYPEYRTLTRIFRNDAALLAIRWRIRRALKQAGASALRPRPRLLFVISTESGGTPQTNRDLMTALEDRYECWLLRCDGRSIVLSRAGMPAMEERFALDRVIGPATHRSTEYDHRVADMMVRHGFELVHIRHIAWHSLGLPQVCATLGIPVVFSFHDFYTLCPTVKLIDAEGRFCAGRCTAGDTDCTAELWPAGTMPPLRGRFVHRWRAAMAGALDACDAFVTTSPAARATLLEGLPFLAARDMAIIPHGRTFARLVSAAAEASIDEPLRVLVPGNISAAKGAALIAAMVALDVEREVEFHLLGGIDSMLEQPRPGIVLHGRYERDHFEEHVRRIQPHLGAVLSIWPETYCHTLTECWSVGLPVLGTDLGAVGERIAADGGGWLVHPASDPATVLDMLLRLKRDVSGMRQRRDQVLDWQRRVGRTYDTAAMAASYDRLYRGVLQRRRSFADAVQDAPPRIVLAVGGGRPRGFQPPLPLVNDTGRTMIFRAASASYPFGDPAAGPADIVLLPEHAVPLRDAVALAARCRAAGLPLLVQTDGAPSGVSMRTALADACAIFLADTPEAAISLAACGHEPAALPLLLDAASWLEPITARPDMPEREAACRLLGLVPDPALEALLPMLDELRALQVCDVLLLGPGGIPIGGNPIVTLRAVAEGCDIALLPGSSSAQDPRVLAMAAAGLLVLRGHATSEAPGETAEGGVALPPDPDAWLRTISELSADAARVARLARRGRRAARERMIRGGQAAAFDALLNRLVEARSSDATA